MNRADPSLSAARCHRTGWGLLGRWLLLLVLAFDLVSSPFHAHSHDLGSDHLGAQAAAHAIDEVASLRADDLQPRGFGHSQAALRSIEPRLDDAVMTHVLATIGLWAVAAFAGATVSRAWMPARADRRPPPPGRFLRPDGRAPPDALFA